jgi:ATP-dependent Clp protease ATP-binding subunit ClpB
MKQIVDVLLRNFVKRLDVLEIDVAFSDEAKAFLIDRGFDPALGARPLKRAIQRYLEDPLSELILAHGVQKDADIHVGVGADALAFNVGSNAQEDAPQP